jgi:uncharacterized membrane protein
MQNPELSSSRLEAFSDGVIAIIITIMVLELKIPHDANPMALLQLWPVFLSYALSFFMVAVYWVNHHYMFHFVKHVDSRILWANNLLLFCMSLIPFFTAYMNEHERNSFSTAAYSGILLVCANVYSLLRVAIRRKLQHDPDTQTQDKAASHKNWLAVGMYICAMIAAYCAPMLALAINACVACLYAMPNFFLGRKI